MSVNLSKRFFARQTVGAYKSKYTSPLKINQYEITKALPVPAHLTRPPYVG